MSKIVLFAFMEGGYELLRQPEKLCKTGIRYTWLLDDMQTPSFATFWKTSEYLPVDTTRMVFHEKNILGMQFVILSFARFSWYLFQFKDTIHTQ